LFDTAKPAVVKLEISPNGRDVVKLITTGFEGVKLVLESNRIEVLLHTTTKWQCSILNGKYTSHVKNTEIRTVLNKETHEKYPVPRKIL
jgi:hypothetical protein